MLRAMQARPDIEIVTARPRYSRGGAVRWYGSGLREVVTWNLLLILRRTR